MSVVWYALWFIVAVGLLVTVHEFGHFWVARRLGFKVLRFSVGFGKPLFKWLGKDGVEYVIAAIPLGGYVKMLDEREGDVRPEDLPSSFTRRPHWQRIAVMLAGPGFNFAFAILLLWVMFWMNGVNHLKAVVGEVRPDSIAAQGGLRTGDEILEIDGKPVTGQRDVLFAALDAVSGSGRSDLQVRGREGGLRAARLEINDPAQRLRMTEPSRLFEGLGFEFWEPFALPQLGEVKAGGPAAQAGLQPGDVILSVDGRALSFREFSSVIGEHSGESVLLHYRRGTAEHSARIVPVAVTEAGKAVGRIQVAVGPQAGMKYPEDMIVRQPLSPFAALGRGAAEAWDLTVLQARFMWRMVMGNVSLKNITGPISIAQFAGEAATAGVGSFVSFLIIISLSLGFLNLLPIPILDGGQVVYQLIEWLKGSPMSERAQIFGQQVGIGLIVMLMGLAFYNDIMARFF